MSVRELLLASGNKKKLAELESLLAPLGIQLRSPDDVGGLPEVDEDRPTFAGNAEKKACSAASASGMWALGDDSGLCVDHLDGAPGVFSARYAGTHGDDQGNNKKLLAELAGVPESDRGAHFVCAIALARPCTRESASLPRPGNQKPGHGLPGGSLSGYSACHVPPLAQPAWRAVVK